MWSTLFCKLSPNIFGGDIWVIGTQRLDYWDNKYYHWFRLVNIFMATDSFIVSCFIILYADIIGKVLLGYYNILFIIKTPCLFLIKFIITNFYKTNLIEQILLSPPNSIEILILTFIFHSHLHISLNTFNSLPILHWILHFYIKISLDMPPPPPPPPPLRFGEWECFYCSSTAYSCFH